MNINCIPTGYLVTNTYLVTGNHQNKDYAFLVDPAGNTATLKSILPSELDGIILTHGHFDHLAYLPYFSNQYPKAKIYIHPKDDLYIGDKAWYFHGEDFLAIGLLPWVENIEAQGFPFPKNYIPLENNAEIFGWKVIHTPGHTPGSICLYNEAEKVLISGDTLFDGGIGRTDLRGGSMKELEKSLAKLEKLPSGICVFPGHGGNFIKQ